jgi:hypothetical protein
MKEINRRGHREEAEKRSSISFLCAMCGLKNSTSHFSAYNVTMMH